MMQTSDGLVYVGIMSNKSIKFSLQGIYSVKGEKFTGNQAVEVCKGKVSWNGQLYNELELVPVSDDCLFVLHGVTIGKQFHWERQEDESFAGNLKFIVQDENALVAVNVVPVETYLKSVISSEMNACAPIEYLKAQAVVSRSWLLRIQHMRREHAKHPSAKTEINDIVNGMQRHLKWYENDMHTLYDVCADDHCQRYEGMTRAITSNVSKAIDDTRGEVLLCGDEICDARFSKSCGGMTERFSSCWADIDKPYLAPVLDETETQHTATDLSIEENAERWIRTSPKAFCNTTDSNVLSAVLNDYDIETHDFFRWTVEYSNEELSRLIYDKSGINFGELTSLRPIKRGSSGRIIELLIEGKAHAPVIIGKELEIRRILSQTHLKSSAFVVDSYDVSPNGVPSRFVFTGAGWGHGVGFCQIGAAVMATQGYNYKEILGHYFKNSEIRRIYE